MQNKQRIKTALIYYLLTEKCDLIQVCLIALTGITRITKRQLNMAALNLKKKTHFSLKEQRGGFRITRQNIFDGITISIKNHTES